MKHSRMFAVVVAFAISPAFAATLGPEWCVAYPEDGATDVDSALKIAAEEVSNDINEATGLKLEVLPASKSKPPAIYIGATFAKKAGFDLSDLKWYDNAIAVKDGCIYLYGNDRLGRDPAKFGRMDWSICVLPSVKAATRFLETFVGVRFLMPGEVGKEVPKRNEVSVPDETLSKERPSIIYGSSGRSNMIYCVANGLWGMGPFHSYGGHTYPDACPGKKYFKDHPEYFGLKNGKRMLGSSPGQTALCISNPEVEELIVAELKRQYDMGAEVCQLAQHDGKNVCECENCKAMYGTGDDWGEKLWLFHRHIAERIHRECPGKVVQIISYWRTALPPKSFKVFPPNVMIEMCRYCEENFKAWKDYTVPQGFTVYTYLTGTYVMPGFVARHSFAYFAELAKRFHDNNVRGVYRCGGNGDLYGTEGPGYYIYNKLLLDGSQNVAALLDDYCREAFGQAAGQMRRFYEIQDARLRMFDKIIEPFPSSSASGLDSFVNAYPKNALDLHGWMFSPDTTMAMEACLERAEKTGGLSTKQKKRIELVRLEFNYAKNLGAISTLYAAYRLRPTKESIAPLLEMVKQRNDWLDWLFCGKDTPRRIKGWPELKLFGRGCTRKNMSGNGRLKAVIGAPLTWPVDSMKGVLPGTNVKSVRAVGISAPPTFDAFSESGGWARLGGMGLEPVKTKAKFKVFYDVANLYVLVEGDLKDDAEVKVYPHDGPCWDDDCIDMLVAPGTERDIFYHFIGNVDPSSRYDSATGLNTNPLDPSYGKSDITWNGNGWKTESARNDGKWRTIVTLPYSDFGVAAPKPGDSWFLNVGRIARSKKDTKDFEYLLWSPNMESRSFLSPYAMGRLMFK